MAEQQGPSDVAATAGQAGERSETQQEHASAQNEPAKLTQSPAAAAAAAAANDSIEHAFETDPGDHAETPFEAYEHLDLLLTRLAKRLGTTKSSLRIYDPFFCEGRMVQHLAALGYGSVYNRNEDFYAVKAAGKCPEFDVLLTNPPFSGDHLERIFKFAVKSNKPWFLLVPQYVARKAFFLEWVNHQRPKGTPRPSYVAPVQQPYVFTAPSRADVLQMRAKEPAAAAAVPNSSAQQPDATSSTLEQQLSELAIEHIQQAPSAAAAAAAAAADKQAATAADGAAAAAAIEPSTELKIGFDVAAGSFQCVWFFSLGERHHKPVCEWVQQQLVQQQQQQQQQPEQGGCASAGPAYCVVSQMKDVPQLMAAPKLTPAERRWRKKQAALAAAGQLQDQQQQQQQPPGGRSGGRQGGSRQQQQQGGSRRQGERQQQRPLDGRQAAAAQRQQHKSISSSSSRGSQFSVLEELL